MPEERKSVLVNPRIDEKIATIANERIVLEGRKTALLDITQRLDNLHPEDFTVLAERSMMFGKPAPVLVKCRERVRAYIEELKIKPFLAQAKFGDGGFIHGIVAREYLHVHLDDSLYILDRAQAKALDQMLINEFNSGLSKAGVIQF